MITSVQLSSLLRQSQSMAALDLERQREDEDIHREDVEELKHSLHPFAPSNRNNGVQMISLSDRTERWSHHQHRHERTKERSDHRSATEWGIPPVITSPGRNGGTNRHPTPLPLLTVDLIQIDDEQQRDSARWERRRLSFVHLESTRWSKVQGKNCSPITDPNNVEQLRISRSIDVKSNSSRSSSTACAPTNGKQSTFHLAQSVGLDGDAVPFRVDLHGD